MGMGVGRAALLRLGWEGMLMLTAQQLREGSRYAVEEAGRETDPQFKKRWASHALALAQLAEEIERREKARAVDQAA